MADNNNFQKTVVITSITAVLTLISGIILNHCQNRDQLKQERFKFEYSLISSTLSSNPNGAWNLLRSYSRANLLPDIDSVILGDMCDESLAVSNANSPNCDTVHGVKINASNNPKISANNYYEKRRNAKKFEMLGYQWLFKGYFDSASYYFRKSDNISPGFHNSYELAELLKGKIKDTNAIYKTILTKYSWGAQPKLVDSLHTKQHGLLKK